MRNRVLITGANGFIGSHCIDYYAAKGLEVYGLDIKKNEKINSKCKFIECNLQDSNIGSVYKEIQPDLFIHCAGNANVGISVEYPEMDFDSNVTVLYKTLSALTREKLYPRFIFLSSAAVYGNPAKLPINEEDATNPISPYGLHKKICEDLCRYYRDTVKQNITVVRIFSAYGERLRKQILWDMYNKYKKNNCIELFGTGLESRDFIHIKDLLQAIDLISSKEDADFVYNVANGEEITIRELSYEFGQRLEVKRDCITFNNKVKQGDPINWRADISKLKDLGYRQSIKLSEGIKNYIGWVRKLDEE